ncbi:MAG: class I SAM-dependent methyltransferase [Elusimicrobia bacterium]|nr:class I SAM-dependent methyltransferase [Elusimicrobiota bacterium]
MSAPEIDEGDAGDRRYYRRLFNYGFIWNLAHAPRRRMFETFMAELKPRASETVLDLGASNLSEPLENMFEVYYPHASKITAVGQEDCSFLERRYPGLRFVKVEAHGPLPFKDGEFDIGFSSATIEHVGSRRQQGLFLSELLRVSKRAVFLTTPNRYFPVELHTRLPLVHRLPPAVFRSILRRLGFSFYAEEANLNLVSRAELKGLLPAAKFKRAELRTCSFFGLPSNLILIVEKTTS